MLCIRSAGNPPRECNLLNGLRHRQRSFPVTGYARERYSLSSLSVRLHGEDMLIWRDPCSDRAVAGFIVADLMQSGRWSLTGKARRV